MKHELELHYVDDGRFTGEKTSEGENIYIGDYYLCTCGKRFQIVGDVLPAFEHGLDVGAHPEFNEFPQGTFGSVPA